MIPKTHLIESLQVTKEHALPPQHNKHYQLSIGCHYIKIKPKLE